MKKMLLVVLMVAGIALGAESKGKYAIVLQAGSTHPTPTIDP